MSLLPAGYLLSLGSNLNPEGNMIRMVELLLSCFEHLSISRVLPIPPVGMNSQHDFLNTVVFIPTDLSMAKLKNICNQIEITLGRDRADPDSKIKDRPADLDILCAVSTEQDLLRSASDITDEYFLYPLITEIQAYLGGLNDLPTLPAGKALHLDNLAFGQAPTTIHRNTSTGNKSII